MSDTVRTLFESPKPQKFYKCAAFKPPQGAMRSLLEAFPQNPAYKLFCPMDAPGQNIFNNFTTTEVAGLQK